MTQAQEDRLMRAENAELLRGLVASMDRIQHNQDTMQASVADIRERVIGIETQGHGAALSALMMRVTALENDAMRREGAKGVIETLLKSPALGWLVGALTAAWTIVTGRLSL